MFRVAHNCAIDRLRKEILRRTEPIEAAGEIIDEDAPDALEAMIRRETVSAALSRFLELPVPQRSAVILKDILGHSLEEIPALLQTSVGATKATLNRGRNRLLGASEATTALPPADVSPELLRYVTLFNARDWDGLRKLLAEDILLVQTARAERHGPAAVSATFFKGYDAVADWHIVPASLDGREVRGGVAVQRR